MRVVCGTSKGDEKYVTDMIMCVYETHSISHDLKKKVYICILRSWKRENAKRRWFTLGKSYYYLPLTFPEISHVFVKAKKRVTKNCLSSKLLPIVATLKTLFRFWSRLVSAHYFMPSARASAVILFLLDKNLILP